MRSTARWPQPDFLANRGRRPLLVWCWALTGALVLAMAAVEATSLRQHLVEQALRLERAEHRQQLVLSKPLSPPTAGTASAPGAGFDAEAERAAQRVSAQLDHPWGQVLANLEAETPPGLQWLVLDHDSDSPDLRFEGVAPDAATALQLVSMLAGRAGWVDLVLGRLQAQEARDATANATPWRFEVRASLDARRMAMARDAMDR